MSSLHSDTQKARLGLGLDESPLELHLGPYYPATSVGLRYCRGVGPVARHRGFPLGCAAAGAEGVGEGAARSLGRGSSLWQPRLGQSGWAGGAARHMPSTPCPQATRDTRLQAGNCGSWGQEQESCGDRPLQPRVRPPRLHDRRHWAVEMSPSRKGSHRDSRKSGEPQGPRVALGSRPH